jgi:hypothetical protein
MKSKKIVLVLILTIVMFCLSIFYRENSICCMFGSNRELGFPTKVLLLYKETDSYKEAQKVYHLNSIELLEQGWKIKIGSILSPAFLNISINLIFYFVINLFLVFIFYKIKKR